MAQEQPAEAPNPFASLFAPPPPVFAVPAAPTNQVAANQVAANQMTASQPSGPLPGLLQANVLAQALQAAVEAQPKPMAGVTSTNGGSGVPVQHPATDSSQDQWWLHRGGAAAGDVSCAAAAEAADTSFVELGGDAAMACAILSKVLGFAVGVPPAPPGAIQIMLVRGGISDGVLDAAVKSRFISGRLKGSNWCVELGGCHGRAMAMYQEADWEQEAASQSADAATVAAHSATTTRRTLSRRCRTKLATLMMHKLEEDGDGDDLYFEGGLQRGEFLRAAGSGHVSSSLLEDMLDATRSAEGAQSWEELLRRSFAALSEVPLDSVVGLDAPARALELLTRSPRLLRVLAAALAREAATPPAVLLGAKAAEVKSVIGPSLGRGALPMLSRRRALTSAHGAPAVFTALRRYPRCPAGDREKLQSIVQRGAKSMHDAIHAVLFKVVKQKGANMEAVLSWLAAATRANERPAGAATQDSAIYGDSRAPTDNFLVGVSAVALRFARPVVDGADRLIGQRLMDLEPLRRNWRHDWAAEHSLTRRQRSPQVSEGGGSSVGQAAPAFVAETFYAAMRAQQVGLLPAVRRFEAGRLALQQMAQAAGALENGGAEDTNGVNNPLATDMNYNAYFDCGAATLLDPELAGDASRFALLQAAWLLRLARLPEEEAREAFGLLPEASVTCMAEWVCFVLRMGKAELLLDGGSRRPSTAGPSRPSAAGSGGNGNGAGLPVGVLVQCATELLSRPELVRHPTVSAALVEMLQHMLLGERGRSGTGLGVRGSSTHELLVSSVLGSLEVRAALCPALIRAYSRMDAVEGLDVDRDKFDKFHTRDVIARLLQELWRIEECVESVAQLRGGDGSSNGDGGELFADFTGCVLGGLMYVLQDSLDRLTSVAEMQRARADTEAWARLSQREREEKDTFLRGQEGVATGYVRYATQTLALLNLLASSPAVAPGFLAPKVSGKAAYAIVHFLEVLLGPSRAELKVENPKKYGFDPKKLVLAIVEFTVRLDGAAGESGGGLAAALAAEDDYDAATLDKARHLLVSNTFGAAFLPPRLQTIIDAVRDIRDTCASGHHITSGAGGLQSDLTPLVIECPTSPAELEAAKTTLMAALGPEPQGTAWEDAYKAEMGGADGTFREADGGVDIADFFGPFDKTCHADDAGGVPTKAKSKKMAREAASLSEGILPCEPGSAVFLRHDPDRLDRMRALITGPDGTPYSGGCFVFDIYFPAGYPTLPPMVNMDTTGGGRVRFNPNLYADGKVCLSLLGTWHGGSAEEKWDATRSNLWQVLVSIQGLILVDDPMYNEPGFDGIRGTPAGDAKSAAHNEEIRLYTVRHAMIAHLKHPRPGVGETTRAHFRLQRHRVMRQVLTWCEEAKDPMRRVRMWAAARELSSLLARNAEGGTAGVVN